MYKAVAYIREAGRVEVEAISPNGKMLPKISYKNLEEVPDDIKNKIKQLLWVTPSADGVPNVGTRVGESTFWIIGE